MSVTIMRGIPGSGKTTWIQDNIGYLVRETWPYKTYGDSTVGHSFSADDYFYDENDNYVFNKNVLSIAHRICLRLFTSFVMQSENTTKLVVDNTNIRLHEIAPYAALAQAFGHTLTVVTLMCDPSIALKRNKHDAPALLVYNMHHTLNKENLAFPPYWPHNLVI